MIADPTIIHPAMPTMLFAQLSTHAPRLREIDPPGLFELLLFENPWILAGLLGVGGIAAFVMLNNRRRARAGVIAGGACFFVAIGVVILASVVQTDRERVRGLSRRLIEGIAEADPRVIDEIMSEFGSLSVEGGLRDELSKGELLEMVGDAQSRGGEYDADGVSVGVVGFRIREIRSGLVTSVIARTQVNVVVTPSITNVPTGTWWEIDWDKQPDGSWRARRIELVWVAGLSAC